MTTLDHFRESLDAVDHLASQLHAEGRIDSDQLADVRESLASIRGDGGVPAARRDGGGDGATRQAVASGHPWSSGDLAGRPISAKSR